MRYVLYLAIVILTLTQIHAQQADAIAANESKAAHRSCSGGPFLATDAKTNQLTPSDLLVVYAANVDGLLRNVADRMRLISEEVDSGELNPLEAIALKLETARAMIARLETISAVYDSIILSSDDEDEDGDFVQGDSSAALATRVAVRRGRSISVENLLRQSQ
jgi:hypothetical protein